MTTDILTPSQTGHEQPEPAADTPQPPLPPRLCGAGGRTDAAWA